MIAHFGLGFMEILSPIPLILLFIGVILGILFGASPGLTTSMGMALMLPITYSMSLSNSIVLLIGLYMGGVSGGLITAILLNIPGTPASLPTTFDGAPMAKNGYPGKALSYGMISSFLGGLFGFVFLFTVAPKLSKIALTFSNVEYFSITLLALVLVAGLSGKSMAKGIMSALIGMMFASVGMAPVDGVQRYTFGQNSMVGGFTLISVLIGVYAIIEVLKLAEEGNVDTLEVPNFKMKGFDISLKEMKAQTKNFFKATSIGTGIGFLPGLGPGVAAIMSYTVVKNSSKYPEKFGTGIPDGIVASEAANNAVIGGALIPLLTMGIPGDAATSMLLAGFMLHGVSPGPLLIIKQPEIVYLIFASLIVANIMMIMSEYFAMPFFLRMLKVPKHILLSVIMVLCVIGAFGVNNRIFDVGATLMFAVIGYSFKKFNVPIAPMMMGFILGPLVERNLLRGLQMSYGKFWPFITRPISGTFLLLALLYIIMTVYKTSRKKKFDGINNENY